MNGIIHGCTHPSHLDVSDVLSERDMVLGIMHYLDRIITQIVKPKVSVFMAIDGVAPARNLISSDHAVSDLPKIWRRPPRPRNSDPSMGLILMMPIHTRVHSTQTVSLLVLNFYCAFPTASVTSLGRKLRRIHSGGI